jgi:hypothetical protein
MFALALSTGLACSSPPDKERGQAEGAIEAARAAAADVYAPADLAAAVAALAQYDAAVAQKDYRQALNAALNARDRAYEAAGRASSAKAEARGRAEQLIQSLDTLSLSITQRIAGTAMPRITGAGAQRLRPAVAAASVALQEARTAIAAENYPGAVGELEAALAALQKELDAATTRGRL